MSVNNILNNPTDEQRNEILYKSLERYGRTDDFKNIVELLSPPPDILEFAEPKSMNNISIGIIGGGLSGLSAAYELRKLGAGITIFDAEASRIGGRVYTYYFDNSKHYYGELGPMRIPVSHATTWHYINLFNLNTQSLTSLLPNNFIYADHIRMRRDRSGRNIEEFLYHKYDLNPEERCTPWNELHSYATDTMLYSLTPHERSEILKIQPSYSEKYAEITKLSNRQVFKRLKLSEGFVNLLTAVNPFEGATLNISHNKSMSGTYSQDFINVYRISDGMVNLPLSFIKSLLSVNPKEADLNPDMLGNVTIKPGYIVEGISQSSDDYVNIHYIDPMGRQLSKSFDFVICTLPYPILRELELNPYFSNQKMQAIRELNYIDAQKTICLFNKRFWEEDTPYGRVNGGISSTDLVIQSIVYPTDHVDCTNIHCSIHDPGVLTASYNIELDSTRLSNQNPHRRFELIVGDVEKVHGTPPGYINTLIDSSKTVHWNNEQWFRGAFAAGYPGQKVNFAYNMLLPEYNGKLFFAGDQISTKSGWMQGALQTGKWAANQVAMHAK